MLAYFCDVGVELRTLLGQLAPEMFGDPPAQMDNLPTYQYLLIALIFVWSGFVRSGLGFGGNLLALPLLLLVNNDALVFLPIISIHLLIFSALTVWQSHRKLRRFSGSGEAPQSSVDWRYLKYALLVMIIPKLVGVVGLISLPSGVLSSIIFVIVIVYAISYILDRPFVSNNRHLDVVFLMLGGYVSGTSLVAAPLVFAVFAHHVAHEKLRDTLFVLWFILVTIKMSAFIYVGVDLQLRHQLWLLPCATLGHIIGLRFYEQLLTAGRQTFFRVIGWVLLVVSVIGLSQGVAF